MTTVDVRLSTLKRQLGETAERIARGERIRVTRHGRAQFALISPKDLEQFEEFDRRRDLQDARRVLRRIEAGEPTSKAADVYKLLGV